MDSIAWHNLSATETIKKLASSKGGLGTAEAEKRLRKYGENKLPEKKRFTRLEIFFRQFKSPLVYLLIIASAISFALNDFIDGYIILAAIILTVAFGYFQEAKAERTLEALEKMVRHKARVLRDGKWIEIEAIYLVPGDRILLAEGDSVSSDIRLISGANLEIQEAALTGEFFPIKKTYNKIAIGTSVSDRSNMAFMGTVISRGKAEGVVIGTGVHTEFGKIAESLLMIKEKPTPLQRKISQLVSWISLLLLGIVSLLFIGGLLRGIPFAEIFATSVAVAVAAIPESLVVAVTVILSIGMLRLLRKKALVRKLNSAETLGSTTIICADKTGTLTEGRMKVVELYSEGDSDSKNVLLEAGMIASEAYVENPDEDTSKWKVRGDPTERALIRAGIEAGLVETLKNKKKFFLDEMPFEAENRYMATLLRGNPKSQIPNLKHNVIYYKGAPEKILEAASYIFDSLSTDKKKKLNPRHIRKLKKIYENLSSRGLRVLAVAYREVPSSITIEGKDVEVQEMDQIDDILEDVTFVGFIAMHDPLRENARGTIEKARRAGIRVAMITGDHKYTAMEIAKELGMDVSKGKVVEGEDLAKMDDATLRREVKRISVYARIVPQDKLRIVKALQANGEVVAMTGDGVNDAPALKQADIGVAMGSGTDVAKEASDMIILDNNFKSIVHAVEQGRVIFDNLKKVIIYLLADSFTEIILIGGSIIVGLPLPVIAGQILWVNLVEDGLPAFALAYEPKEKDVMKRPPPDRKDSILDKQMKVIIFIVGIITSLMLFGLFVWLFKTNGDIEHVRTVIFAALGTNSLLYIFSIKSLRRSIFNIDLFNNRYLIGAVLFGFAMIAVAIYVPFLQNILRTVPLGVMDWVIISAISSTNIIGIEIAKHVFISRKLARK